MKLALLCSIAVLAGLSYAVTQQGFAQNNNPPSAPPASFNSGGQETIKVVTEEVRIPVFATDERGRFDPTLEKDDLVVLEDRVPQEIRSIRRLPASVMVLVNTSGDANPAMKTNTSREVAVRLLSNLRAGDRFAVMQYGRNAQSVLDWTSDREQTVRAIQSKLSSTRGAHLGEALKTAGARFEHEPAGNRHLVLITDGVDDSDEGRRVLEEAVRRALTAQVTVHVISYSQMGRRMIKKSNPLVRVTSQKPRKTAADIAAEIMNPTGPPPQQMPSLFITLDTDFQMRRRRGGYVRLMKEGEALLKNLAEETGGVILLPQSAEGMIKECEEVARAIGSQYVVTYRPKRSLASAAKEEYRQIEVRGRKSGLNVRTRRGYVVLAPTQDE